MIFKKHLKQNIIYLNINSLIQLKFNSDIIVN